MNTPVTTFGMAKAIWAESPPTSIRAINRPDIITAAGFKRARKATIIAVNPYPKEMLGCN